MNVDIVNSEVGLCVLIGSDDTFDKNSNQFVTFLANRTIQFYIFDSNKNFKANKSFAKFIEYNFHFMNKIFS